MATCSLILVQLVMIFLLQIKGSVCKNQTGLWLLSVRETQCITVKPDGTIISSPTVPTLYNLFRVQTYQRGFMSSQLFTLEAMATNTFICMNEKGKLITMDRKKTTGKKKKRSPPSTECLFHSYNFGRNDWNPTIGIYLESHRVNGTVGKFIAFDKEGKPLVYRRKLRNLKMSLSIVITLKRPKNIQKLIKRTHFPRCNGSEGTQNFNRGIRRCLGANQDIIQPIQLARKNIYKVIHRCKKAQERMFCQKKMVMKSTTARSIMRQNSKQRYLLQNHFSFNETTDEEELRRHDPCHCVR